MDFRFPPGYYRAASDTTKITLSDGKREMLDSEFGAGENTAKVRICDNTIIDLF